MNTSREELLFQLALTKPAAECAAWLDRECGEDKALRARLDALLAAHEKLETLLATQAETARRTTKLDLADAPDEAVGMTLGRYKLREKIGEGGCGTVYVAEQTEPVRRKVALKVIKLGMDTREVIARFEAERQALAMMDHPNIAKVLDAGTTDSGRPYFVMELVRGIRITDYCDQANLSTKERLDLFIKVCQAIQHAHQKGIIHRDIKPGNILVTLHDGVPVPKVIDFGIAKATEGRLTDATVYTQLHQFMGTPAYMSPEQAEMTGLDIDTRSDIYSLGVLLYQLLTGKTPFDGKDLLALGIDEMRRTIREKEPVRPSTRVATLLGEELTTTAKRRAIDAPKLIHLLKGDLDWIVMKALENDRTRRYDTANGLAVDITRYLTNEPIVARPPSTAYKIQKAWQRNKLAFSAAAAVALALIVGISVSTWQAFAAWKAQGETEVARTGEQQQRRQAQSAQKIAETEQQRADAEARKATESQAQSSRLLYAADMNLAQWSLKESNLGKARRLLERHRPQPGEEDLRGWECRYLWQLTRGRALATLTHRPARGWSVSFSPDGTRLAVGWADGRVDLWDVPAQRLIRALTDREYRHSGQVAFSPVRNLLAATSEPKVVTLYDLDSGRETIFWRASEQGSWSVRDLSFSPDGSRVVIYAGSTRELGDAVWVVSVSSFQIESRHSTGFTGDRHFGTTRLSPDNLRLYLAHSDYLNSSYRIRCLDPATSQELWQTEPLRDLGVTTLAVSPDKRVLVSGSGFGDPTIHVWDATTGRPLARLSGHTTGVFKLAFTRDGRRLISSAADQSIRFWDTSDWTETKVLRGHTDEVQSVAISESAQLLASISKDGDVLLWREDGQSAADGYHRLPGDLGVNQILLMDNARLLLLPPGNPPQLVDLKFDSPPVSLLELGSSTNVLGWFGSNILCHWDGTNQILVRELRGREFSQLSAITLHSVTRPRGLVYNATRQLLAWAEGPSSESVYVTSLARLGRRIELKSDVPGLAPFRFSEDGTYLAAWTEEGKSLRVWNVETGQKVVSIGGILRDATFADGGRVLVVAIQQGNDHEIGFHDLVQPDRVPRRFPGRHHASSLAVSPAGGLVAASTHGGEVRLFDPVKGPIDSLYGHLNAADSVAFSPDGRRLISTATRQEAVKLWDVGTRQELLTLVGIGEGLGKWSADGSVIHLAGKPWQAWRAPSWEEIAAAEAEEKRGIQR